MIHQEGSEISPEAATRVHYATDPRIRRLAESAWRLRTGGTYQEWLMLGKDNPETLISEAREWTRAAVAGRILPPPEPAAPALAGISAGQQLPIEPRCSFCGKTNEHVTIVQGPGVAICGDCIELVAIAHSEANQPAGTGPGRYCSLCERIEYTPMCPNQSTDGW